MVFGNRQNVFNTEKMDLNLEDNKLYRRLADLEDQLKVWRNLWRQSYLIQTKHFTKWQNKDDPLPEDSVVMITDHFNSENGYHTIATVKDNISPRTYILNYVKIPAKLDSHNKIITQALMSTMTRSSQSMVLLCGPDEDKPINIDPYSINPKLPSPDAIEETIEDKPIDVPVLDNIEQVEATPLPVDPKDETLPDDQDTEQTDNMMKESVNTFQDSIQDTDENLKIIDVTEDEIIDDKPTSLSQPEAGTVKTLLRFVPDEKETNIVEIIKPTKKKRRKAKKY